MNIENKIKQALDKIRPNLQADGGDVRFVRFDEKSGVLKVELTGRCAHCPMAQTTLKQGIEAALKKEIAEVKEVVSV